MKQLFEIFTVFFKMGLFTIGGGYAMLPLIQKEVVENRGWMTDSEFLDAISLTNSLPGPLAANAATFVGYKLKKVRGSFSAVIGVMAPSIIIILLIAAIFSEVTDYPAVRNFFRGITPAVAALILYSVIKLAASAQISRHLNWLIALASFAAITVFDIHPIIVILAAAVYGLFLSSKVAAVTGGKDVDKDSDTDSNIENKEVK